MSTDPSTSVDAPAEPAQQPPAPGPAAPDESARPAPEPADASDAVQLLQARLAETEQSLVAARAELQAAAARRLIQRALLDAHTIDLDAATLLIEASLKEGVSDLQDASDRDARRAVQELRRRKPALFRPPPRLRFGAMGMHVEPAGTPVADAAESAARTGDRTDLLRYLRMRRAR